MTPRPGASSFRCKGLVYQGAKRFYDQRVPGGAKQVGSLVTDEALRVFWDQSFVAGGWYDALPIVELSRIAAHAAGVPHTQLVKESARNVAERDVNGVYKVLLKLASPELVVKRLPRAALQYFDFGTTREEQLEGKSFTALQSGIPEIMGAWMSTCIAGFAPVALELAGAKNVRVRSVALPARSRGDGGEGGEGGDGGDGAAGGVNMVDLRVTILWD